MGWLLSAGSRLKETAEMRPLGYRVAVRTAAFLFVAMACQPGQAATFHVSPDGRDAWSATLARPNAGKTDGPFASLGRARNAVRALKAAGGPAEPLRAARVPLHPPRKAQLVRRPSTLLRPVSLSNRIAHACEPIAESQGSKPPGALARFLRAF